MRPIALILALWPLSAGAVEWEMLEGDALRAALEGRKLVYTSGAWQEFRASGKTLYNAGEDSWGNWRVQGDQYCSQWPPSDLWACYDVQRGDDLIRFIGPSGDFTDGFYAND